MESVMYGDERVADTVRSLNRQVAVERVAGFEALGRGETAAAVEHFYIEMQLNDRCVDATYIEQVEVKAEVSINACSPHVPNELQVMDELIGLFNGLGIDAKVRVLDWARSRFVV